MVFTATTSGTCPDAGTAPEACGADIPSVSDVKKPCASNSDRV